MCLLIETIKVENRSFVNMNAHNERFNKAREMLFCQKNKIRLENVILIPPTLTHHVYKCRVIYSDTIHSVEFSRYSARSIRFLRLVEGNHINYSFKFYDRAVFDELLQTAGTDDVMIIKNGKITDTTFANIVLYDGLKWVTPAECLLEGTCRNALLKNKLIELKDISYKDIWNYKFIKLINAMNSFNESPLIPVGNILK